MFTNWSCHPLKLDDCTSYGLLMITWNKHVPVRMWRLWRDLFEKISPGSILWTSQTPRSKSSSSRTWDFIILVMRDAGMLKVKKSLLIFNWIFYQDLNVNTFWSSLLALIGFPTELCNHVCVGPGPEKIHVKASFAARCSSSTYTLSGISGTLSYSGSQFWRW